LAQIPFKLFLQGLRTSQMLDPVGRLGGCSLASSFLAGPSGKSVPEGEPSPSLLGCRKQASIESDTSTEFDTVFESDASAEEFEVISDLSPLIGDLGFEADYELHGQVLGRGASGTVQKATCKRSGDAVAVKRIEKHGADADALARLRAALRAHEALHHPGIVELHATYESEEAISVVMEELLGEELLDRVNGSGRFTEEETAKVAVQLLSSVAYMHSRHVVHRDIKLDNLMCKDLAGSPLCIKLIDFDLCARCRPGEKLQGKCGTPQYASPELILGKPYDACADMWSIGVVIYAILVGKLPFKDEHCVVGKSGRLQPFFCERFNRLSRRAQDFIHSLLRFLPEQRLTACQALEHPWLRCMVPAEVEQALHDLQVDFRSARMPSSRASFGKGQIRRGSQAVEVVGLGVMVFSWLVSEFGVGHIFVCPFLSKSRLWRK